jgi:glycosyltransferase involved in cell wall biosynthesis
MISIVIPAYNAAGFLAETLQSIAAQEYADWELIVVEDGTDDGTRSMVTQFAQGRPQGIHYLRHEKNQGLPATRNTGIAQARGEWVAFIDADDLWTSAHLRNLHELSNRSGADLLHTGVILFQSETGEHLSFRDPDQDAIAHLPISLFEGNYPIQPSSSMVRTKLLRDTGGFDVSFRYVEDREYWIRLVRHNARIAFSPEHTCLYRQHGSAMTQNAERMSLGIAMVHDKHGDWEKVPKGLRCSLAAKAWLTAGRIILRTRPSQARKYFRRSIHWKKSFIPAYLYWCVAALLSLRPSASQA